MREAPSEAATAAGEGNQKLDPLMHIKEKGTGAQVAEPGWVLEGSSKGMGLPKRPPESGGARWEGWTLEGPGRFFQDQ